jgi:effector-binding domain-containing protein
MGRTCAAITAYDNMDMQALDVEIGVPVPAPLPGADDLQPGEIPGGRFATCTYVGLYDQITRAYEALNAWMGEQGLQPAGVSYEHYLNHTQVTPPESLETGVRFAHANE